MLAKKQHILVGILIGSFFAVLIFQNMALGPWAYNDSSAYVSAARNIAGGNGSSIVHSTGRVKQLTEFPPFYPFTISVFGGQDGDYVLILKWLNSILFGISIYLFFMLICNLTACLLLSSVSTLIFGSFRIIIEIYTGAMSEPLFLCLLFAAFNILMNYLLINENDKWFILLIIFSALLPVTRYAGILFVGIFGFSILLFDQGRRFILRVRRSAIYLLFSYLPIGIWAFSLIDKYQKFAGKDFLFGKSIFRSVFNSSGLISTLMVNWIPYVREYTGSWFSTLMIIAGALILLLVLLYPFVSFFWKNAENNDPRRNIAMTINITLVGYFVLIVFMHTTSSPPIDVIDRTILPVFPLLVISISYAASELLRLHEQSKAIALTLILFSILFLRYNLLLAKPYLQRLNTDGIGYTSRQFIEAGTVDAIKAIDNERITISNLSGFVLFHTNKYPIYIENFPQYSFGGGDTYGEKEFREQHAALILLKSEFSNYYGASADPLYHAVTSSLLKEYEDEQVEIFSFNPSTQQ